MATRRPRSNWLLSVLMLSPLLLVGCGGEATVSDATNLDAEDSVGGPFEKFEAAVRERPDSADAYGELGLAYEMGGRVESALQNYLRAAELDEAGGRWRYLAAIAKSQLGDLEAAIVDLDRVLELASSYTPAHLYRGRWLLDLGRVEEAGESFGTAARLSPDESAAWVGIARVHLKADRPAEALELLTRLLAQRSNDPYVYQLLGQAYRDLGDIENAKAALAKAKPSRGPSFSDPWHSERFNYRTGFGGGMLRASELMKQNKVGEAITLMEQLRAQDPDDRQLINNLSVAYRNAGQPDRAFKVLQDGLQRHPDYYPFHLNISADYQRFQDNEAAMFHLNRVIEISPTFALAYERLGNIYHLSGDPEKALESFLQAHRYAPDNATYALYAGVMASRLQRWEEAVTYLSRATEIDPRLASAWIPLGSAQIETGQLKAAKESLDRAEALAPDSQFLQRARQRLAEVQGKS